MVGTGGSCAAALRILDAESVRFERGQLKDEQQGLRLIAVCMLGRNATAAAKHTLRAFGGSARRSSRARVSATRHGGLAAMIRVVALCALMTGCTRASVVHIGELPQDDAAIPAGGTGARLTSMAGESGSKAPPASGGTAGYALAPLRARPAGVRYQRSHRRSPSTATDLDAGTDTKRDAGADDEDDAGRRDGWRR
jgi:hypothetical protein